MAEKLDKWPEKKDKKRSQFPFDEWADGDIWRIDQDKDFTVAPATMEQYLRMYGNMKGLRVHVKNVPNKNGRSLVFQFSK